MSVRRVLGVTVACALAAGVAAAAPESPAERAALIEFERAITASPEDLHPAADYRQLAIATGQYDRAIHFLEKLADAKASGPNIHISLALALVDKVPPSGDIRRLYLARDAMGSLTRAITRKPSVLAYFVRGLINLYFNNFIFHRIPRGIQDLEQARALCDAATPPLLVAHVHVSLGDGYWRNEQREKAREMWKIGASRFPEYELLRMRLAGDEGAERAVSEALYAGTRVDTSLREMRPSR